MAQIIPGVPADHVELDTVRVVATQDFKAAIGGSEIVNFKKGVMHPQGFQRPEVEIYLKDGRLKAYSVETGAKMQAELEAKSRAAEAQAAAQAQQKALDEAAKAAELTAKAAAEAAEKARVAAGGAPQAPPQGETEAQKVAREAQEASDKVAADAAAAAGGEGKPTLAELMALTKEPLIEKALEVGAEFKETDNKETIAKAILVALGA